MAWSLASLVASSRVELGPRHAVALGATTVTQAIQLRLEALSRTESRSELVERHGPRRRGPRVRSDAWAIYSTGTKRRRPAKIKTAALPGLSARRVPHRERTASCRPHDRPPGVVATPMTVAGLFGAAAVMADVVCCPAGAELLATRRQFTNEIVQTTIVEVSAGFGMQDGNDDVGGEVPVRVECVGSLPHAVQIADPFHLILGGVRRAMGACAREVADTISEDAASKARRVVRDAAGDRAACAGWRNETNDAASDKGLFASFGDLSFGEQKRVVSPPRTDFYSTITLAS